MEGHDEPVLGGKRPTEVGEDLGARIERLLLREPFAVLCTQGGNQPYGSVVAVAFSDDLRHALFATPITTRKYRLLTACPQVALVVDDRSSWGDDTMAIEAVTLTGRAVHIERGEGFDRWAQVLVGRHPSLEAFVRATTCALFRIDATRYFHVERFQEVREWTPPGSS